MDLLKSLLKVAKSVQDVSDTCSFTSVEITPIDKDTVLSQDMFKNTRGYIEKVVYQINSSYDTSCYDASAVMIRRLIEVLIIEIYEQNHIEHKIKSKTGDFLFLDDLIDAFLSESTWNLSLSRNTKKGLKQLKTLGDLSAHSRRYNANRHDLDKVINDLRVTTEELLYLAGLKH